MDAGKLHVIGSKCQAKREIEIMFSSGLFDLICEWNKIASKCNSLGRYKRAKCFHDLWLWMNISKRSKRCILIIPHKVFVFRFLLAFICDNHVWTQRSRISLLFFPVFLSEIHNVLCHCVSKWFLRSHYTFFFVPKHYQSKRWLDRCGKNWNVWFRPLMVFNNLWLCGFHTIFSFHIVRSDMVFSSTFVVCFSDMGDVVSVLFVKYHGIHTF